jgi:hypothetical protein
MFGTNCAVNVVTEFVEYYMAEDGVPYEPDGERPTFRGVNDLVYSDDPASAVCDNWAACRSD